MEVEIISVSALLMMCSAITACAPAAIPGGDAFYASAPASAASRTLRVTPSRTLADVPVHIVATGLAAGAIGHITVTTHDSIGATWSASVDCVAGTDGQIDLDMCDPIGGSYAIRDGMGLFWSMKPVEATPDFFVEPTADSTAYDFTLTVNGSVIATAHIDRVFATPGVRRINLSDGISGTAFLPPGGGRHPAIIFLGGSGGRHPFDPLAALLASRGYVALSLAYFGSPGTPANLVNVPIETVSRAIDWLDAQQSVDTSHIGILGHSRGSELALLSGAYFPKIKAVVVLAPSTVVWSGLNPNDYTHTFAAWTYDGHPLASVTNDPAAFPFSTPAGRAAPNLVLRPMFLREMQEMSTLDSVRIPIERTNGPILFVAGDDDQLWPSATFSEMGMKWLHDSRHKYHDVFLHYPNAGHWMFESYVPVAARVVSTQKGRPPNFGGTVEGDGKAAEDSWPRIVDFFAKALQGPSYRVMK